MRIVIELKRDAYARVVLNNLYKQTPVQSNFGANMLALVGGEPHLLTVKEFLRVFLEFRVVTITRRTQYELRKAQDRDHLLQGLLIALGNLDAVIRLIRAAADTATAKAELVEGFGLSEVQADAILQMQLRRLTALEADKINAEHDELQLTIADLQDILARKERIDAIIEEELGQIKTLYATPRRTEIVLDDGEIYDRDLIANEQAIILLTEQGYIKRMPANTFGTQSRATRGKAAAKIKEDDGVEHFLSCCDHDQILFFSDRGVVYGVNAYQIPVVSRTARGVPIIQMLPIPKDEKITSILAVSEFTDDTYLIMLTKKGSIKKTALSAFSNIRSNGLIAISLADGDQLRWVRLAKAEDSIIIGSRKGMTIHFRADAEQLRPLGRATKGVKSMKMRSGDELISMDILPSQVVANIASAEDEPEDETSDLVETEEIGSETNDLVETEEVGTETTPGPWVLAITTGGFGKRVPVTQFRLQRRAGMGVKAIRFKSPSDQLAAIHVVNAEDELMLVTNRGIIIRQTVDAISTQSRTATGVRVQRLDADDAIAAVALVPPLAEGEEEGEVE